MKIVIVESEQQTRETIEKTVKTALPDAVLAGNAENGRDGRNLIRAEKPDGEKINTISPICEAAVEKDAAEKASQISEKELQRGHSAAISVSRGVLSETKSALVKHAFEMAAESFVSMEEHRYLSIMAPMLAAAVREFPEDAVLTLVVPATHPVTGDALIRAAGVSAVGKTETRAELAAGFLLCSDTLEIDCTPSKLIFDRYDVLSPRVAEILFAKEG